MAAKKSNNAQLKNRLEGRFLQAAKSLYQKFSKKPDVDNKQVVFVAGVQRSGTNMITQILERVFDTMVFRESDPRAYDNYELRDLSTIRSLIERSHAKTIVFKCLCELHDIGTFLENFPNCRVIWMYRRMDDMVNSHLRSVFVSSRMGTCNNRINAILSNQSGNDWRAKGMSEETRHILSGYAGEDLTHQTAVALFWLMRNRLFFEQSLAENPNVRAISYEDFVQNPQTYGRALLQWLGLRQSRFALGKINPRSIGKNTPPVIEGDVRIQCDRLYEEFDSKAQLLGRDS